MLVGHVLQLLQLACLISTQTFGELLTNQLGPLLVAGPSFRVIPVGHRIAEDLKRQRFHREVPRVGLRLELGCQVVV